MIKHVLVIGYGSVGQCIIPLLLRHMCAGEQINVIELGENADTFRRRLGNSGVTYETCRIVKDNMDAELSRRVSAGDFLVDCSVNISGQAIVQWCLEHGVRYINTSIERWETQPDETIPDLEKRTLYEAHRQMHALAKKHPNGPTCVITHGANPGLVSHFVKQALLNLSDSDVVGDDGQPMRSATPNDQASWGALAKRLGVRVIQISERDTQRTADPKKPGEFVNTWSCEGFWAEGRAPAELGWGTHESAVVPDGFTQGHCAYLRTPGVGTLVKGWVPLHGQYNGFLIQHSEAVTLSDYFSTAGYRPTTYYAYCPCDDAIASVHEFRGKELEMQTRRRIIKNSIVGGIDELGVLLLGDFGGYWYGSQLSVHEARALVRGENATSLQVASSMLGAIEWAIRNPARGIIEPEALPHDQILKVALPYLGPVVGVRTDWKPAQDRSALFPRKLDSRHPLRFENFLVN